MWLDLMIDTETMGLPPDGALMSIGACFFDMKTRAIGPTFSRAINLATAVRDGGTIKPSTVMWWLGQSQQARDAVRFTTEDIRTTLADFSTFIAEHSRHKDVIPWGNSSAFDLTIIGGAYDRIGVPVPWSPFRERCFRTLRNLYPSTEYNTDDKGAGAHNALEDAIFQAKHIFRILDARKGS